MSEEAPFIPVHGITDQSGVPIIETAQAQVATKQELTREHRTARLEGQALNAGVQATLDESKALSAGGEEAVGSVRDYYEQQSELSQDAQMLSDSRGKAFERVFTAEEKLQDADTESAAHVDENLPGYVAAATRLANTDIKRRIGLPGQRVNRKVVVTSRRAKDGIEGFTNLQPVDPATKNEDVASPQEVGPTTV